MNDRQLPLGFAFSLPRLCSMEEEAVARALPTGRANAMTIDEIASRAGLPSRTVQDVVSHLILVHQLPIGTAMARPFGNYFIDSDEDFEATVDLLRRRGISNLVRAAALKKMPLKRYLLELPLDDVEDDFA